MRGTKARRHGGTKGLFFLPFLVLAGCHAPNTANAPRQDTSGMSDMVFLHYLATAPTVTVSEGVRSVLMLSEVTEADLTKPQWDLGPDSTLDKGTLAYMLRCVCGLPRGVNEVVLVGGVGLGERRYALQTCIYEGLMPYGRASEPVTGGEVLSALTAAENSKSCRLPSPQGKGPG